MKDRTVRAFEIGKFQNHETINQNGTSMNTLTENNFNIACLKKLETSFSFAFTILTSNLKREIGVRIFKLIRIHEYSPYSVGLILLATRKMERVENT